MPSHWKWEGERPCELVVMKIRTLRGSRGLSPFYFLKPLRSGLSAQSDIQAKCDSWVIRKVEIGSVCSPLDSVIPEANKCLWWGHSKSL